jgi:hypothetical protein
MRCLAARIALAAVLAASYVGCGGARPVAWKATVDTGIDDSACALVTDGRNLFVVGSQVNPQTGRSLWLVQSLNRKGEPVRRFPLAAGKVAMACDAALNEHSDLYVCGRANPNDTNACLIARFRPEGLVVWKRGLIVGEQSWAHGICLLPGGRLAVCGAAVADQKTHVLVAVFDTAGTELWDRTYDLGPLSEGYRIACDTQGNMAIIGRAGTAETPDLFLMKLGPRGDTLWTRRYDSGGDDFPGDITFGALGYILATGTARTADSSKCVVLTYSGDGEPGNRLAYGADAQAEGHAIYATAEGKYFVTGRLILPKRSSILAFQYLPDAVSVWERDVALGSEATGVDLFVDRDVFVAATVRNATKDIVVLKLTRPALPAAE